MYIVLESIRIVLEGIRIVLEAIEGIRKREMSMLVEDMSHELKRCFVKDIVKSVVAFANSVGGKIYIGVEDSGQIVGVNDCDEEILKLTNAIRDGIRPDVTSFISTSIEQFEDMSIIVCEVQKGTSCPYYLTKKGIRPEGVYIRQGASSVPASQATIFKMIKETNGDSYEELRSLNQNLSFEILEHEFENAEIKIEKPQMKTLNIIGRDALYTNLGLLLSKQNQHTIKAAVFEGITKNKFRDRYEFDGSLLKQMRDVYSFLNRYNRTKSVIKGLTRVDIRDYPEVAIREAILNSIIHKDYAYSSSTLISVFDDRIEIITVGGLVKGITKEDILLGTSILRNKNLANVFYRLKLVEAYGTGILKINEAYAIHNIKPQIDITDNAFKITLPAISMKKNNIVETKDFNNNEMKILELLKSRESIVRKDVEALLSVSQPMAVNLLKSLLNRESIERIGKGKNVIYQINHKIN